MEMNLNKYHFYIKTEIMILSLKWLHFFLERSCIFYTCKLTLYDNNIVTFLLFTACIKFQDLTYSCSGQAYPDEELPLPEECIVKITALLKVFTTVVKSLGDSFSSKGTEMSSEEIIEVCFYTLKLQEMLSEEIIEVCFYTLNLQQLSLVENKIWFHLIFITRFLFFPW